MLKYDVAREYSIYCDTDSKWVSGHSVGVPTECFEATGHTVSTTKKPMLHVKSVEMLQHDTTQSGSSIMNFTKIETLRIKSDLLAADDFRLRKKHNSIMRYKSPSHPAVLFGMHAMTSPEQGDDCINLYVGKHTVVGVLAAVGGCGDYVVHVMNPPVNSIAEVYTGYEISLNTGYAEQVTTIDTTGAYATLTQGEYVTINSAENLSRYYLWIDTTGDCLTGDPQVADAEGFPVDVSAATDDAEVAAAFEAALATIVKYTDFTTSTTANVVTVTNANSGPADSPTSTVQNVAVAVTTAGLLGDIDMLGDVVDVNTALMKIRTEKRLKKAYPAYTTRVLIHRHVIKDLHMGSVGGSHTYGEFQVGSMYFPAGTVCHIEYANVHPEDCFMYVDMEWGEGAQDLGTITE
jgi:hypothetical protein